MHWSITVSFKDPVQSLNLLPAVKNYHKRGGLKPIYFLMVLEARGWKSGYLQGHAVSGGSIFSRLFQLPVAQAFLGLWLNNSSLYVCLLMAFSSPCVSLFCESLMRTLVVEFRTHPENPDWSNLKLLNLKRPFSKWVHIHRSWELGPGLIWTTIQPITVI